MEIPPYELMQIFDIEKEYHGIGIDSVFRTLRHLTGY